MTHEIEFPRLVELPKQRYHCGCTRRSDKELVSTNNRRIFRRIKTVGNEVVIASCMYHRTRCKKRSGSVVYKA